MIDMKMIEIFEEWHKDAELAKNRKPSKFEILLDKYEERFGDNAPTEPSSFSEEKWCEILEECLEKNITVEEMYGIDYDDEDDIY